MLSGEKTYVCVVGDDDQSIYKFRGAEVRNILDFQKQFPGTQVIKLVRNYRSFAPILGIADAVVSHNTDRLGKTLTAERGEGKHKPELIFLANQDDEAHWVSQKIKESVKLGVPFSDWAILYRTNAQSLEFETEFLHKHIPYSVVGALKFYEREEIKDIVAYLSFLSNPKDEISFRRIVNKPARTVGSVSQDKIISLYQKNKTEGSPYTILDACIDALKILPKKARDGINEFVELIQNARVEIGMSSLSSQEVLIAVKKQEAIIAQEIGIGQNETLTNSFSDELSVENVTEKRIKQKKLSDFIDKLIEKSHIKNYHESQDEISGTQRVLNLQEFVNSAVLYECTPLGLCDFLDHIELDRSLENPYGEDNEDAVTLITLHNTKGLEFPRVIITGLEYGVFPRRDKVDSELEEERRLFYVGLTRAQNELYLTSCTMRRLYGRTDFMEPSPFLSEIKPEQIEITGKIPYSFRKSSYNSQNSFGKSIDSFYSKKISSIENDISEIAEIWQKGKKIYHDDYGYGMIIRTTADDAEYVITVQFENGAVKRFMPKYNANRLMIVKD
jgi:DNA helicase-2/ATP-dependent DNA helicase PcrA